MGGELYIAVALAAALVASLAHFEIADRKARANARARLGLDEAFGDWPAVPEEGLAAAVGGSPGGGGVELTAAKTQHSSGTQVAARGAR